MAKFTHGQWTVSLRRSPEDTSRPATLWTATCDCGWSHQWGTRGPVSEAAWGHLRQEHP